MLHQLDENGTMAVVLPHGVLFRGAAEGHIRQYLIEQKNCLDMVIGLPANIFYGTSIPTCILVLKKQRKESDNVLFIDASAYCGKASNQNFLRNEDLERILDAVEKREFIDKFAYVAMCEEIKEENEFNLNIPRYVDTFIEEETINLIDVTTLISSINNDIKHVDDEIAKYCNELDIETI